MSGTTKVIPHLCCANAAEAIEFYKKAFGADENLVMKGPDGKIMHGSLTIDGAPVYVVDEFPDFGALGAKSRGGTPVTLHMEVADSDAVFQKAAAAGCTVVMPLADMFWGSRYGLLEDPYGHRWAVSTTQREVSPEEAQAAVNAMAECA